MFYSDVFYCIFDRGKVWWYGNRSSLDHYPNFSPPKHCLMKHGKQYAASHRRIERPVLLDVNVKVRELDPNIRLTDFEFSSQHGRRRLHFIRHPRPRAPLLRHYRLRRLRNRWPAPRGPNRPRKPLIQQTLPNALHRHLRNPHPPLRPPSHPRPPLLALHPLRSFHHHCRHRWNGRRRPLPYNSTWLQRDDADGLRHRLYQRHEPRLRVRRAFHVLHPHLRDAPPRARHARRIHTADLRHDILCRLRDCDIHISRLNRRLPELYVLAAEVGEGGIRHCDSKFLDCWQSLQPYGRETALRAFLPKEWAFAFTHSSRLVYVDSPRLPHECCCLRARSGRTDLQLPDRYRGESVCELVHVWDRGRVLAVRRLPRQGWIRSLEEAVGDDWG